MSDVVLKNPDDTLDYDIDFSKWLPQGDEIISVSNEVEGSVVIDSFTNTASVVKLWISGGTLGETARVSTTVVTSGGRTKEYCFRLRLRDAC